MINKTILIISVHPDDETLGCGGLILRELAEGSNVFCAFVTEGNSHQSELIDLISQEYRFTGTYRLGLPEIILDDLSLSEIIPPISDVIKKVRPDVIIIPNRSDPHSDHRRVFDACQACIKSFRYPFVKKVLMCEIQSETDFAPPLPENVFIPNVFVDISLYFEKKMQIMSLFESELLPAPMTRSLDSIKALHRYRGSQCNVQYAEAFMLIKELI
jgi:N-acetylglucosamine malate deacetylase 1